MQGGPARGLPPKTYVPILVVAMLVFLGVVGWFLRIGLDVKGAAFGTGPSQQGDANIRVAPSSAPTEVPDSIANVTDAPGEVDIPQTGGGASAGAPSAGAAGAGAAGAGPGAPQQGDPAAGGAPQGDAPRGNAPQGVAPQVGGGGPAAGGAAGGPPAPVLRLLTEFRSTLAERPNDLSALVGLANLYFDAGKYAQALPYYRRALALDPGNPDTRTDYATALHGDGDDLPALAELHRVLAERPNFAQALFNEGVVDSAIGRRTDAAAAFRAFLKVSPGDAHAAQARAALAGLGPT